MKEIIAMSRKEMARLRVMQQVESGAMTVLEGSEAMGVGNRQGKRIWARYKREGAAGLIHAARGRVSNRRMPEAKRQAILTLYKTHYGDYGPTLASEVLEREHGVRVHRETLRRLLHEAHCLVPRTGPRRHRRRRARREHFGELVQMDGSIHAWFENRRPAACLMVAVDDATGRSLTWMAEEETTADAFTLLAKWIRRYGLPRALYTDRKNLYVTDREPTREEKRQGSGALTDFGRACWRLGIRLIAAHSPQAKGRVERRNGLLQDRLVKELRRQGIVTPSGANALLDVFTDDLDQRFALQPASPIDRHGAKPSARLLREILCWEESRVVARDWTVTYHGGLYQILRQEHAPRPGQAVTLRRLLDGTVKILDGSRELATTTIRHPKTMHSVTLPPMGGRAFSHSPSPFP